MEPRLPASSSARSSTVPPRPPPGKPRASRGGQSVSTCASSCAPCEQDVPAFGHVNLEIVLDAHGRDEWDKMSRLMKPPPKVPKRIRMATPPRTPNRIVPRFPPLGPALLPKRPLAPCERPGYNRNASSIRFEQPDAGGCLEKHLVKTDPQSVRWTQQQWRDAAPVRRTIKKRPLPTDASIVLMA
eukprot:TRINITY_DN14532_c0_g1_i1.p1 TRINITY_DN14532_c0_g1~~TRINITY_DN14532_c0_g1_i1.p1  ORF type:complete len:185 (+),score=25.59 TRINITY_DN14532_c0_g1_i1:87-641(+)